MKQVAYPSYKPAGVDWLEKVPSHWDMKRLRFAVQTNPLASELRCPPDTLVSFVPMEAVGEYGGLALDQEKPLDEIGSGYTYFRDDDVVVAKITPCFENGKGALARGLTNGIAFGTTELHVLRSRENIDPGFLFYLTVSDAFRDMGEAHMYGAGGQKRVPELFIKDLRCPLPPTEEQRAIVAFLDAQTARIDTLVSHKKQLINNIEELFIAQVTRAVTKGVNPAAALSNPRTEWFDAFPDHWDIKRLRYVTKYVTTGITPPSSGPDYFVDDGTPWFTPGDFKNFIWLDAANKRLDDAAFSEGAAKRFPARSVLLVGIGATLGKVGFCPHECSSNQQVNAIVCSSEMIPEYLALYLTTRRAMVRTLSNASTLGIINQERTKQIPCLVPPVEEQREIIDQCKAIEDAHIKKRDTILRAIDQLLEYRSAIITAAVTGQIKVV